MSAPVEAATLKRTPLHALHRELGAKLIDFGGWEMPVQYQGILEEHRAVRERAGIFDVSHMGELEVTGSGSLEALQRITPNDVTKLGDGRCHYSAFLTERGTFVDDLLVYRRGADSWMLVVNASNTPKDFEWARARAQGAVRVENRSDDYALLAVQGPRAPAIVARVCASDPSDLPYYAFRTTEVLGKSAVVSRTGYTGEDGFELYLAPEAAEEVFRGLLEAGRPEGIVPCGLGARDTLRLEAKMALYGNDIDDTVTPWEADLGWIVKMKKGDFLGREALERQSKRGSPASSSARDDGPRDRPAWFPAETLAGLGRRDFRHALADASTVRSACALPAAAAAVGTEFSVDIRGRQAPACVVETPFYKERKRCRREP
jgi:aminomethyltransferase